MTIDERIKQLEEQITLTNQLLAELKAEREKENKESVLEEYWNCLNSDRGVTYYVDGSNKVYNAKLSNKYDDTNTDRYANYPTKEYAEQAQKIKEFNDKLLAFKWCYDRDYEPKWECNGLTKENKYYVYYDDSYGEYDYDYVCNYQSNLVYFSSEKTAKKCCDWLNTEMKGE